MHRTCTNNPVKSDRRNWLIHREVQFEVCFLRPCSEEGSDATKPIKNNSRLRQQCRTSKLTIRRRGGSWVEPLPIAENWQVRMADQAMYHQGNQSVFVGGRLWTLLPPPAYMSRKVLKNTKQTEGSFTSVQMVHTHTIFHTQLCHTQLCHTPSFTHSFVTHHRSHTTLSHTIFHTQLCHPPSFTHNFVTHHLSHTTLSPTIFTTFSHSIFHTTLSPTIFHTQLCHPPSFTDNFVTHTQLCQTPSFTHNFVTHHLSHTTLSHTTLSHTIFHTPSFTHNFVTHHLLHTTLSHTTLSHNIFHTQLCHPPSSQLCHTPSLLCHTPSFCAASVGKVVLGCALGRRWSPGAPRHFAWQAWRRGAAALCVASVALGDIHLRFAWQAWPLATSTFVLRGRRGTSCTWWRAWSPLVARGAAALCVAGVALGDIHLGFTWQAWHLETSTFVLRGRRGTSWTWWRVVAVGCPGRCGTLRGRRGTW